MDYNISKSMDLELDYNNDFVNYQNIGFLSLENYDDFENSSEFAVNNNGVGIKIKTKNQNENKNEWELVGGKSQVTANFYEPEDLNCEANYLKDFSFDFKNFESQSFFNSSIEDQPYEQTNYSQQEQQENENINENENENSLPLLIGQDFDENFINIEESGINENDNQFYNQQISQGEEGHQIENVYKDELFKASPLRTSCYNNISANEKEMEQENSLHFSMSEENGSEKQHKSLESTSKTKKKSKTTDGWNRKTFKVLYGDKQRVTILKIKRTRRKRKNTTEDAKEILESWFNEHYNEKQGPYPNKYTRNILAKKTNTPELQVQRWFGQRRRIEKERWENGEIPKPNWI
ncbi:hypothetical protein M0813_11607 [Anaeramoeba flamelloides]|uniref:Homeobox domain-containing protein n=1 Tax=Anaeramoeba flamelloides TaxID=1746091 RepID=A0ABQ8ZEC0_9EUKA|nr:hypothetical protein M0813_11607 [Anaeramoeba flamelloides]